MVRDIVTPSAEIRALLRGLGLSQRAGAALLGVGERTMRRWCSDDPGLEVPPLALRVLRAAKEHPVLLAWLSSAA